MINATFRRCLSRNKRPGSMMWSRRCKRDPNLLEILQVFVVLCFAVRLIDARVLTPYEQAVGQWDVTVKANGWKKSKVSSMLFPPLKSVLLSGDVDIDSCLPDTVNNNNMHCHLSIFPNGTFVMDAPSDDNGKNRMPLRGNWKLQPNPYCITDRQYDQLVLESYPRVQKQQEQVLQRVDMRLQCRVWGRYGSGPIRKFMGHDNVGRSMSRITHGTLLWNVRESQEPPWKSQRVCASFTAKPVESSNEEEEEEDFDDEDDLL